MVKGILNAAVGLGSVALVAHSTKALPKVSYDKKGGFKMKTPSTKKLFKTGTDVLVGTALLGATAKAIK